MVTVIEPIHEFQSRMPPLARHDPDDVFYASPWRLFTKYMEISLEPGNRHFRRDIIGQADNEYV